MAALSLVPDQIEARPRYDALKVQGDAFRCIRNSKLFTLDASCTL